MASNCDFSGSLSAETLFAREEKNSNGVRCRGFFLCILVVHVTANNNMPLLVLVQPFLKALDAPYEVTHLCRIA